jgi:uncharacterized protein
MMRFDQLALVALISVTAGCFSHGAYRHIYSLDGTVELAAQPGVAAERPVLQLQRVLVPDYLDTTDIQLRTGAHEIHESATGRFAERLSLGITHALRSDIASRLPLYTVALGHAGDAPARQILVNVEAFDVAPDGRCLLVADWSILDVDHRVSLAADRGTFTATAAGLKTGDAAIVAAMAEAVRQLAERVAATVPAAPPRVAKTDRRGRSRAAESRCFDLTPGAKRV